MINLDATLREKLGLGNAENTEAKNERRLSHMTGITDMMNQVRNLKKSSILVQELANTAKSHLGKVSGPLNTVSGLLGKL